MMSTPKYPIREQCYWDHLFTWLPGDLGTARASMFFLQVIQAPPCVPVRYGTRWLSKEGGLKGVKK